jgi:hypothetical protein
MPYPILGTLPQPGQIRARLSEITQEANFLRRLLRLLDQRPRCRELAPRDRVRLDRRQPQGDRHE